MPGMFTMSPEVQAYGNQQQQPQGPEAMDQMFRQRFSEMAYQTVFTRFPDLAPNIVSFKVLEQDSEQGDALGVFIVSQDGAILYVPVVLVDSRMKPLEILYSKDLGVFLPLTRDWVQEVIRLSLGDMGRGQDMPPGATTDVNIRNLVNPPTAEYGRVGYASDLEAGIGRMLVQLTKQAETTEPQFLNVLRSAPRVALDGLKLAFEKNPQMAAKLAAAYGKTALVEAIQSGYTKCAAAIPERPAGKLSILTKTASKDDLKRVFGKSAGDAFYNIRKMGMAILDERDSLKKMAVDVEGVVRLQGAGPGANWMRVYSYNAPITEYLVVPIKTRSNGPLESEWSYYDRSHTDNQAKPYLAISSDLTKVFPSRNIAGDIIAPLGDKKLGKSKAGKLLSDKGDTPSVNAWGFFLNPSPKGLEASQLLKVTSVTNDGGVTQVCTSECGADFNDGDVSFILGDKDDALRGNMVFARQGSDKVVCYLPKDAKFVQLGTVNTWKDMSKKREECQKWEKNIITDPTRFKTWLKSVFKTAGAEVANVKSAGVNNWWVGGLNTALTLPEALHKVATDYQIAVPEALKVLSNAQKYGHANTYILDKVAMDRLSEFLYKISAEQPQTEEQPNPGAPEEAPEQKDPAQQDPQAPAAAPAPAPIAPTDLAIGEALQQLQQQNQMSQQQNQAQMQQLQQKMDMEMQQSQALVQILQGIQQRSVALSQATGGQIPAGAEQSPAVAAQAIAPIPPEEPPPPASMGPEESFSPEQVAQQINPNFVDQAADLNDQGIMDAGAIATIAAAPIFQDISSIYVPQLEKALDNLGRVMLTLWIKERETKQNIGDNATIQLSEKLRTMFKNMGDLVLQLNRYGSTQSPMEQQTQIEQQASV